MSSGIYRHRLKGKVILDESHIMYNNFQVLEDINPPTKLLGKFVRTWKVRNDARSQYIQTMPSSVGQDRAGVALLLSRQLIAVVKVKNLLHIEAGLQMMALAMSFSSEVSNMTSLRNSG
jgi:hypothetical protein